MTDMVDRTIDGRFELLERIGRGGMATVYRARQLGLDREVAVKLLSTELSGDEDMVRRFEREARIICQLEHPYTLRLIEFGRTEDDELFLVTELLRGETLAMHIDQMGKLDHRRTTWILDAVCQALAEAHDRNIFHRDLKPSNIFIQRIISSENIKVLDFGLAKMLDDPVQTEAGMMLGTPMYASPEQASAKAIDGRSDIYSLGVVAYECLRGDPPFGGRTSLDLLMKHSLDSPPPLGGAVPPALSGLVMRMLAKNPKDRPSSVHVVLEQLRDLSRESRPGRKLKKIYRGGPLKTPLLHDASSLETLRVNGFELIDPRDLGAGQGLNNEGNAEPSKLSLIVENERHFALSAKHAESEGALFIVDAHPEQVDPSVLGERSVMLGQVPTDEQALSAALRWLCAPTVPLAQYLGASLRAEVIRDPALMSSTLATLCADLEDRGVPSRAAPALKTIARELLQNALFHAPNKGVDRALEQYSDLGENREVLLNWGLCESQVVLSVRDAHGSLVLKRALKAITEAAARRSTTAETRGGLGLLMTLRRATHVFIAVDHRRSCEVTALLPKRPKSLQVLSTLWLLQASSSGLQQDAESQRLSDNLWMKIEGRCIVVQGDIDEQSDLGPLFKEPDSFSIDLGGVDAISSGGVRRWIVAQKQKGGPRTLERCPAVIVEQILIDPQFSKGLTVGSALARYFCNECPTQRAAPIKEETLHQLMDGMRCGCGGRLELDETKDFYVAAF